MALLSVPVDVLLYLVEAWIWPDALDLRSVASTCRALRAVVVRIEVRTGLGASPSNRCLRSESSLNDAGVYRFDAEPPWQLRRMKYATAYDSGTDTFGLVDRADRLEAASATLAVPRSRCYFDKVQRRVRVCGTTRRRKGLVEILPNERWLANPRRTSDILDDTFIDLNVRLYSESQRPSTCDGFLPPKYT